MLRYSLLLRKLCLKCDCIESPQITKQFSKVHVMCGFFSLQFIIFIVVMHRSNRNTIYENILDSYTFTSKERERDRRNKWCGAGFSHTNGLWVAHNQWHVYYNIVESSFHNGNWTHYVKVVEYMVSGMHGIGWH